MLSSCMKPADWVIRCGVGTHTPTLVFPEPPPPPTAIPTPTPNPFALNTAGESDMREKSAEGGGGGMVVDCGGVGEVGVEEGGGS